MELNSKNQIKTLLAQRGLKLKELAFELNKLSKRKYSANSLTQRLSRGSITYDEVLLICKILNYKIEFSDLD